MTELARCVGGVGVGGGGLLDDCGSWTVQSGLAGACRVPVSTAFAFVVMLMSWL